MKLNLKPLIPLVGAVLLAACETERSPETADLAAQGIPPTIKVTTNEQHHTVYVSAKTGTMKNVERADLVNFISDAALGSPDTLHVRLRGGATPQQLSVVTKTIVALGVAPSRIEIEAGPASGAGGGGAHSPGVPVEVVATISHVDFPSCPRQSWVAIGGVENPTSSNFGCSYITAIEAQVADPRDLVQGETGGQTDATLTNAAIDRLHTDKVKKAEVVNISQVGGGGGQ